MAGRRATVYTCPDCGGVLWQDGAGSRSPSHASSAMPTHQRFCSVKKSRSLVRAMGQSAAAEEGDADAPAGDPRPRGRKRRGEEIANQIEEQAELDEQYARTIQELLGDAQPGRSGGGRRSGAGLRRRRQLSVSGRDGQSISW